MEYWSDGRTTESPERKIPKETKITEKVARVRKKYWCKMVQITAKCANWCKTALAYGRVGNLIFDWEEEACLILIRTNFHEFWSRIFVVCGP